MKTILFILLFLACSQLVFSDPLAYHNRQWTWTAPGDDGDSGQASGYSFRYSVNEIIDSSIWLTYPEIPEMIDKYPKYAGGNETLFVNMDMEYGNIYYFALKTKDEIPNWSFMSNIVAINCTFDFISSVTTTTWGDE